jgi:hypothetical protein
MSLAACGIAWRFAAALVIIVESSRFRQGWQLSIHSIGSTGVQVKLLIRSVTRFGGGDALLFPKRTEFSVVLAAEAIGNSNFDCQLISDFLHCPTSSV